MKNTQHTLPITLVVALFSLLWLAAFVMAPAPTSTAASPTTEHRVLMFVAYNDVWWPEYKVAYESLTALGYTVDVVSSGTGEAYSYGGGVDSSIQTSWGAFTALFAANFGVAWNPTWTAANTIPLSGRLQDIANLSQYEALVIPGGRGRWRINMMAVMPR